jgi:DNA repair protein RecO (recombination protein O)
MLLVKLPGHLPIIIASVRLHSSDAFILGTHALKETDRIVSFLTRDNGKKRGVAKGARRSKSTFSGALEPMTEARVVYYEKEGRDLVSINAVDPIRPSFSLSKDLEAALLLSTLAESLETFVSEADPAEPSYRLARHAMDALFAGAPAALAAAYFDVWILKLSGLFPSPRECAGCGRALADTEPLLFDERRPGFVGAECRQGETLRLTPEAQRTLAGFLSGPLDPAARPKGLAEIARVARLARRHFLGHELKSQRVLAEVLG